jgi:hypothetical protein
MNWEVCNNWCICTICILNSSKPFVNGVWSHETCMKQMLSWGWHIYLWLNLWNDRYLTHILLFWEPLIMANQKWYIIVHLSHLTLCQGFVGNPKKFKVFSNFLHYVQCKILLYMVHVVDRLELLIKPIYLHIDWCCKKCVN